jgi:GNAT superfamily N-acetyltransferase
VTGGRAALPAALIGTVFRRARPEDLPMCAEIWRDSINDYLLPLNQEAVPDELGPIGRLYAHTRATDPDRFIVAAVPGADGLERLVGFGSAVVRGPIWFLSMLFVRPEAQGQGLGRALLEQLLPGPDHRGPLATAVDSLQPISTALYARYGIVPRVPILDLRGDIRRPEAFPALPSGIVPVPFSTIDDRPIDDPARIELAAARDGLDRELLGADHPEDHGYLRAEGRQGFLYRGPDGSPLGYGYAGEVGRIGPIALRDEALLEAVVGHLSGAVPARGARAVWATGGAPRLASTLLAAGLRIDGFPLLLCWDRPFADLSRYLPISPGLL